MSNAAPVGAIIDALEVLPPGTLLPASEVRAMLKAVPLIGVPPPEPSRTGPVTWREKLWTVTPETRLDIRELAEALNRSRSWVAARLNPPCNSRLGPIPHRKFEGQIQFLAGEVRSWMNQAEVIAQVGTLETQMDTRLRKIR